MSSSSSLARPEIATGTFWVNTGERVVRTGAQTAIALGVTNATTALDLDWQQAGTAVGLAMLAALLTALAGKTVGDAGSPSFLLPAPRTSPEQHGRHEAVTAQSAARTAGDARLRSIPGQRWTGVDPPPGYDRDARNRIEGDR